MSAYSSDEEEVLKHDSDVERKTCIDIMYKVLKTAKVGMPMDLAKQIDAEVYKYVEEELGEMDWEKTTTRRMYATKMTSIYRNICPGTSGVGNPKLLKRIKNKEITPEELVHMTPQQLFPERWNDIIKKRDCEEDLRKKTKGIITTVYTCSKCKNNECTMYQMQTRSVDEGTTTFLTCTSCGNRWKQ